MKERKKLQQQELQAKFLSSVFPTSRKVLMELFE